MLLLVDLSYLSRFWTQFEAWLAMQHADTGGLRRAQGAERRETFVAIYNATDNDIKSLQAKWAAPTPKDAHAILSQPDITVTNKSDKIIQLQKLLKLQATVLRLNQAGEDGALRLVFGIERAVGPKPAERTWRDEWVDAWMERKQLAGENAKRANYEPGGISSIDKFIGQDTKQIEWKVNAGWPREQAEAYTEISMSIKVSLAAAVRERSDRYAASTHEVCEALEGAARRQTEVAPLMYGNLVGLFGYASEDPAWEALRQPGAMPGLGLVTNGIVKGMAPSANTFPDDKGYCICENIGGKQTFVLQDSDIVCIRSAPKDAAGYHSLVQVGTTAYSMPPLSTVTLEKVQEPGEWEVRGYRVQRRLYTVSLTFK